MVTAPSGSSQPRSSGDAKKWEVAEASRKLLGILPFFASRTNILITRLQKLMSTIQGTDRALTALNYLLIILTSQLEVLAALRSNISKVSQVSVLPAKAFPNPPALLILRHRPKELSKLYAVSIRLKALAALIADVRIFMRLWGLLGVWQRGVSTWQAPPKDKLLRFIAYLQVTANFSFQVFENSAYLAKHGVLPFNAKRQSKLWIWSARCWATYVALEFVRLARDKQISLKGKEATRDDIAADVKNDQWLRQLYSNMAYAPLTIHWSLEKGCLNQATIGTLGGIAGWIGLQQAWRNTA